MERQGDQNDREGRLARARRARQKGISSVSNAQSRGGSEKTLQLFEFGGSGVGGSGRRWHGPYALGETCL